MQPKSKVPKRARHSLQLKRPTQAYGLSDRDHDGALRRNFSANDLQRIIDATGLPLRGAAGLERLWEDLENAARGYQTNLTTFANRSSLAQNRDSFDIIAKSAARLLDAIRASPHEVRRTLLENSDELTRRGPHRMFKTSLHPRNAAEKLKILGAAARLGKRSTEHKIRDRSEGRYKGDPYFRGFIELLMRAFYVAFRHSPTVTIAYDKNSANTTADSRFARFTAISCEILGIRISARQIAGYVGRIKRGGENWKKGNPFQRKSRSL
jgi:hypothetical protein